MSEFLLIMIIETIYLLFKPEHNKANKLPDNIVPEWKPASGQQWLSLGDKNALNWFDGLAYPVMLLKLEQEVNT